MCGAPIQKWTCDIELNPNFSSRSEHHVMRQSECSYNGGIEYTNRLGQTNHIGEQGYYVTGFIEG